MSRDETTYHASTLIAPDFRPFLLAYSYLYLIFVLYSRTIPREYKQRGTKYMSQVLIAVVVVAIFGYVVFAPVVHTFNQVAMLLR